MPIRIGRLELDVYRRTLHIHRNPDPNCPHCHGDGEVFGPAAGQTENDVWESSDFCSCWSLVGTRIPLWIRRTERHPF